MCRILQKYTVHFIIFIVLALNLFLSLSRLGTYSAVDEPYWTYGRTSKFWTAVDQHKWKSTNINDKPGITVALLSGFGLLKYDPMQYEHIRGEIKTDAQRADIDSINFFFRLPIFLFCTFMLPLFYFFLRKLFSKTTALIGFVFIGLSPILLGISLIINPDSLLWIFLPLSLLAYLTYQKKQKTGYLIATSVLLGLSLLTKYVANILYIFFFILPFLEYVFAEKKPELKGYLIKSSKDYLVIATVSMATYYLLYPAAWAHLNVLLEGTFLSKAFVKVWPVFVGIIALMAADIYLFKNRLTQPLLDVLSRYRTVLSTALISVFIILIAVTMADTYLGMKPFDLEAILASPKGIGISGSGLPAAIAGAFLANTYSLIFGMDPIVFIFLILGLFSVPFSKQTYSWEKKTTIYFVLFIVLYYSASTFNDVIATIRYQIILYPLAFIIAAIGATRLLSCERVRRHVPSIAATGALLLILAIPLFQVKPFYFTYASPLLPEQYLLNTKDMGDGSFEAASMLNALPNARDLVVWSDKGAVCTEFIGTCNIGFSKKDITGKSFDYFVISTGRISRSMKLSGAVNDIIDFRKLYDENTPYEASIVVGGRPDNFVRVIKASAIAK